MYARIAIEDSEDIEDNITSPKRRCTKRSLLLLLAVLVLTVVAGIVGFVTGFWKMLLRQHKPVKLSDINNFPLFFYGKQSEDLTSKTIIIKANQNQCPWLFDEKHIESVMRNEKTPRLNVMMFINWINNLDLVYSLLAGSLLGAVRHHGFLPNDYDIDVQTPIFLNKWSEPGFTYQHYYKKDIIHPNCSEHVLKERPFTVGDKGKGRLCGWTKLEWISYLVDWFDHIIHQSDLQNHIKVHSKDFGVKFAADGINVDFSMPIFNDGIWNNLNCLCPFDITYSYCYVDAHSYLKDSYGEDYMIPNRDLAKDVKWY